MEAESIEKKPHPDLTVFSGSDWPVYQDELYRIFCKTLLSDPAFFLGMQVRIKRHPEYLKMHFAFWHLITEGEKESERTPDLRRCERIAWIRWVIENNELHPGIYYWKNLRKGRVHVVIWYKAENYVVILEERKEYYLLKTAYVVAPHRLKSLQKEMDIYCKKRQ